METFIAILLALAIYTGVPAVIGFTIIGGVILTERVKLQTRVLVCATDADCPPGYICIGGRCVRQRAS